MNNTPKQVLVRAIEDRYLRKQERECVQTRLQKNVKAAARLLRASKQAAKAEAAGS